MVLLVQGILPVANVYLTREIVNRVVEILGVGGPQVQISSQVGSLLLPGGLLCLVLVSTEVLQSLGTWLRTVQSELIQDHLSHLIQAKSISLDYGFFESADYHDRLNRVQQDASSRSQSLIEHSGSLIQNSLTLLSMAGILTFYGVWLPLILFISTLPAFYVLIRQNRRYHEWWQRSTPHRRMAQYYEILLTQDWPAAELRIFQLGQYFQQAYQTLRERLRHERIQLIRQQSLMQMIAAGIALLAAGGSITWMSLRVLRGEGTLGDLALFYQAFQRGQSMMRSLLSNMGQIYNSSLFLENLYDFLDIQPQLTAPTKPLCPPQELREGIRFEGITFRYPESERLILHDFHLTIPAGQIVAIVGSNGAGKSTLVKLLCRLYDPEAGAIHIDSCDIRNFDVSDLRGLITVLFQHPVPYQATVAENIAYGDLAVHPTLEMIQAASVEAGADDVVARLPHGYQNRLGKWFAQGTELSGGEWQRIALARAFLRQAPIIVLDEPTSFMDLWSESDWLRRFRKLAEGRTALIITHRFSLAMQADVIHVMKSGQIVESGNHQELLHHNGLYAQAWYEQLHHQVKK